MFWHFDLACSQCYAPTLSSSFTALNLKDRDHIILTTYYPPLLPLWFKAPLRTKTLFIDKLDRSMKYKNLCIPTGKVHREDTPSLLLGTSASANVHQPSSSAMQRPCWLNTILGLFCCLFAQRQKSFKLFLCPFHPLLELCYSFPEMYLQFCYPIQSTWHLFMVVNFSYSALAKQREE